MEKSDDVAMKRERLRITRKQVEVEYEFRNESEKDLETLVAFPMPEYSCGGMYARPWIFSDFVVETDGKRVKPETELKAFVNGKDVTELVRKRGYLIANCPDFSKLKEPEIQELRKLGLSEHSELDDWEIPSWSIRAKYYWKMLFPAKKSVQVKHRYAPQLGSNSVGMASLYAAGEPKESELMRWGNEHRTGVAEHGEYILRTGNNWKNGIESLELIIEGDPLVWAHFENQLYSGIGRLRFARKQFRPTQDLSFAFQQIKDPLSPVFYEDAEIDGPANLRTAPKGKVIASIPDGAKVKVAGYTDGWFQIVAGKQTGFTTAANIRPREPKPEPTGRMKTCSVEMKITDLKKWPDFKQPMDPSSRDLSLEEKKADEGDCRAYAKESRATQTDFYHAKVPTIRVKFDGKEIPIEASN